MRNGSAGNCYDQIKSRVHQIICELGTHSVMFGVLRQYSEDVQPLTLHEITDLLQIQFKVYQDSSYAIADFHALNVLVNALPLQTRKFPFEF